MEKSIEEYALDWGEVGDLWEMGGLWEIWGEKAQKKKYVNIWTTYDMSNVWLRNLKG